MQSCVVLRCVEMSEKVYERLHGLGEEIAAVLIIVVLALAENGKADAKAKNTAKKTHNGSKMVDKLQVMLVKKHAVLTEQYAPHTCTTCHKMQHCPA